MDAGAILDNSVIVAASATAISKPCAAAQPSPLMIQGGIEVGLDDAFRFETVRPTPLDSGFRRNDEGGRNDGSCAKAPLGAKEREPGYALR